MNGAEVARGEGGFAGLPSGDPVLEARLAARIQTVGARLARRRSAERAATLVAALLVGVGATLWGMPIAAGALLAACAAAALLALMPAPGAGAPQACVWLDARVGRRSGDRSVLWQSAVGAAPPFRQRLVREVMRIDDEASPAPLRRQGGGLLLAATALVAFAAFVGGSERASAPPPSRGGGPAIASDTSARSLKGTRPSSSTAALDSIRRAEGEDPQVLAGTPPTARAGESPATPTTGQRIEPLPTGSDPAEAARAAQAEHSRDRLAGSLEAQLLSRGNAAAGTPEELRVRTSYELAAPGAQQGEGVGVAASSSDGRPVELPEASAVARGARAKPRPAAEREPAGLRDSSDNPSAAGDRPAARAIRPTPLATGRWALTAAEQSYLLRWSRLRDLASPRSTITGPPQPPPPASAKREER